MTGDKWLLGHRISPIETLGDFGMLRIVTAPGVPGPPPHHHTDSNEFFYVVEGALEVVCDGKWTRLGPGESANVPQGAVHTFRNPLDTPCTWLTAWSPRGFERLFMELGVPAEKPSAMEGVGLGRDDQRGGRALDGVRRGVGLIGDVGTHAAPEMAPIAASSRPTVSPRAWRGPVTHHVVETAGRRAHRDA